MSKKELNKTKWFAGIFIIVLGNYFANYLVSSLDIPLFLDTWATVIGVMIGGLWFGVIGGIVYNIFMAIFEWGLTAWVWMFSSILVACIGYYFYKKKWIDLANPLKLIAVGLIIGVANSIVTILINVIVFNSLPTYEATEVIYKNFLDITGNPMIATFGEHFFTEIADKTIVVFMAALIFEHIPKKFRRLD